MIDESFHRQLGWKQSLDSDEMVDEDKNHSKKTGESKTEASSSWNIENRETCQCLNDQNTQNTERTVDEDGHPTCTLAYYAPVFVPGKSIRARLHFT